MKKFLLAILIAVSCLSFTAEALEANLRVIIDALLKARPSSTKGAYMLGCTLSATMTPGVRLNSKELAGE